MKKTVFSVLLALLAAMTFSFAAFAEVSVEDEAYYAAFRDKGITLNVYNWGEYISDGSDDSVDVIKEFEEISGIKVNYTLFDTNEDMYAKVVHGGSQYDIIIPSDYMIARLIDEDRLEKLDFDKIPNISLIDDKYRYTDFDPEGAYTVPYTWGMVGLVYNTKHVTAEEASTWDILWNEKFKGKVLMFGNSRDAFGIALKKLGYSLNTENLEEIDKAADALKAQKAINQMYAMDQTFDKMANENAYAAPYYAGDCLTMMERNEDLAFSYPKEGVNQFIDSICIPKGTTNKDAAEAFINFLCETDIAVANCEFISYFTPQTEAMEIVGVDERIMPSDEVLENSETFVMLGDEANSHMEDLWLQIRSTSMFDSPVYLLALILLLALIIFIILYVARKKKNSKIDY
ncbi:MAG: ABC transporter substrate-binding protein [Eubacteriales bacterium]|jgi:spermidine/putrescine transport system substrate-binding protein